jgi:hypothetical protein
MYLYVNQLQLAYFVLLSLENWFFKVLYYNNYQKRVSQLS